MTKETYEEIVFDVVDLYEQQSDEIPADQHVSDKASFLGCLLRTAGHDFMDFRTDNANQGGSDGCINFNDPDNKGIQQCLQNFKIDALYKQWKK